MPDGLDHLSMEEYRTAKLSARQGQPPITLRYTHPSSLVALFNLRYALATPQEADPLLKNRDRGRSTPESAEDAV